jgi:peptidyl-prolyl cis-trans isomerase A (cyclophilin A)
MTARVALVLLLSAGMARSAETAWALIRTDAGDIEVSLDAGRAPATVANFLRYVDAGHYTNGQFHRAVRDDNQPADKVKIGVIQAGRDPAFGKPEFAPIKLERTNATGLRHVDGAISMARTDMPDSATSQFYITDGAQPGLDDQYAAFGVLIDGFPVRNAISAVPVETQQWMGFDLMDVPVEDVLLESAYCVPSWP